MRIEHLEYLICLAQTKSTKQAAQHLFTSHQNVSKILRQMEEELGAELFVRTPKGLELTNAGAIMVESAQKIVAEFAEARANITNLGQQQALSGEVHLYVTPTTSLLLGAPLSNAFHDVYPQVTLYFHEHETLEVLKQVTLHPNSLALAPILTCTDFQFIYEPYLNNVAAYPLVDDSFVCVTSAQSPLNKQKSISLRKFVQYPQIVIQPRLEEESCLLRLFSSFGQINIALSTGNPSLYTQAVSSGRGVAASSKLSHEASAKVPGGAQDLTAIPFRDDMHLNYCLITSLHPNLSPASTAFVQFVHQYYRI